MRIMRCREGWPSPLIENPGDLLLSGRRLALVFFDGLEGSIWATLPPVSSCLSFYIEATLNVEYRAWIFPLLGMTRLTLDFII